ncbi:MAG: EAL domain-containing protein [Thermodesulfovibrionales bacterium]
MSDNGPINSPTDRLSYRTALYLVILALIILGFYILSSLDYFDFRIVEYFLSMEQSGIKFRALILLAPFVLTMLGYLINQKAKLLEKTLCAETELRQRSLELEKVNELLTNENAERRKAEEQLAHSVFYDSLTNLPNRALFVDRLQNSLDRKRRHQDYTFAVLFLDVDRFKVINDSVGHLIGDQLLILLSQRLKRHVRASDTIARFGGDEFAILIEDIKEASFVDIFAARIQEEMRQPYSVFGHEMFATVSIGIVFSNQDDYSRPNELLRDADTAMYHAKAQGRACHMKFDTTMHVAATMSLRLETDLWKAIQSGEFTVYYQPIMSVEGDNNVLMGFEALLRWQHPELGFLCPADFIGVAEDTGLIIPIGEWVIREACRQMRLWQEQFPERRGLTVSVNVSHKVFYQRNFYEFIEKILRETCLEGCCLRLEITEKMLIENPEPAAALIRRLKGLEVRFDIDDFGAGYSALNYLRHFEIRGLKIDGSFINALTTDKNNAEIVKTIIALGHILKLDVIAEGVETIEQLEIFRSIHGQQAQGFFLFRPMDSKAAGELLAAK